LLRLARRSRALSFAGQSVVIVGGSRGLGLVLARQLAHEGARLALLARDREELERARADLRDQGADVTVISCDVRDRADVESAIASVVEQLGGIDVLINDAGVIQVGPFSHMAAEDFQDALATHFWGPFHAVAAVLPHMRRGGARRIVNISSIGGKIAVPHLLPYSASKFALTGLSEGLRAELAQEGIVVTTVCPGLMRTGSTYNALFKGKHRQEFAWFHVADALPGFSIDARRAARQILDACRHAEAELIITWPARLAVLFNALCPETTARILALTNRVLPGTSASGDAAHTGWQSTSRWVPSKLTALADRATLENNETPVVVQE
jgi:NAD(P)-dependent dehydrogenase (short-subunit alcohol dehydrogenase family)